MNQNDPTGCVCELCGADARMQMSGGRFADNKFIVDTAKYKCKNCNHITTIHDVCLGNINSDASQEDKMQFVMKVMGLTREKPVKRTEPSSG